MSSYTSIYSLLTSQCDPSVASYQAIKSIEAHENHKVLFFFGGACSLETEPLATIAGNFYKIPTVNLINAWYKEYSHAISYCDINNTRCSLMQCRLNIQ